MASARDLKNKIRSIANTKKITRTMELVATSKAQRAQSRVRATQPYSEKLTELLSSLAAAGTIDDPLLRPRDRVARVGLLVVTGQRGLCGGYNSSVMHVAERLRTEEIAAGREVDVYMVGRKGLNRLRFLKVTAKNSYTHFDDRPSFQDASDIADTLMEQFLCGALDRVVVVSTRYLSAGVQRAEVSNLLPIEPPAGDEGDRPAGTVEFIFEPGPELILREILPLSVRNIVYRLLVEAVASEQLARRMAMKRATDNAEEMLGNYRRLYNRSRQAGITQQINEIVSGAVALD